MRAAVIGADGFVGRWLVRHLRDSGDEVIAIGGPHAAVTRDGSASLTLDARDATAVMRVVSDSDCDHLYYLAGVSDPREREDVSAAIGVAVIGAVNTLAALATQDPARPRRLLHVGSSHVYGDAGTNLIDEQVPPRPSSVYGATKLAAEQALAALAPEAGVDVVMARPFNHAGPGQRDSFVVPSIARQVAAIAPDDPDPAVTIESASMARDFTDVRDVVRAYRLMLVHGSSGDVFNVASGKAVAIGDIVQQLLQIRGLSARIVESASTDRGEEAQRMVGSFDRLHAATGWQPEIPLRQTLADVLAALDGQ